MLNPVPYIPPTYWNEIDQAVTAVMKLQRIGTVLWACGCSEAVWGYTGGHFDRHVLAIRSYIGHAFSLHGSSANAMTDHAPAANAPGMVAHGNTPVFIDLTALMKRLTIPIRPSGLKLYMSRAWGNYQAMDQYFYNLFRLVRNIGSPEIAEAISHLGRLSKDDQDIALQMYEDRFATYLQRLVEVGIIANAVPIANASGVDVPIANASDVSHVPEANAPAVEDVAVPSVTAQLLLVKRFMEFLAMWPLLSQEMAFPASLRCC